MKRNVKETLNAIAEQWHKGLTKEVALMNGIDLYKVKGDWRDCRLRTTVCFVRTENALLVSQYRTD